MKRMTLEQVDSLLDNGIIQVEFNPSRDDVEIPDNLRSKDVCHVNFSYNYWPHDLLVDEDGIGSTLSFKGDNHWCSSNKRWAFIKPCKIGMLVWVPMRKDA